MDLGFSDLNLQKVIICQEDALNSLRDLGVLGVSAVVVSPVF